MSHPTPAGGHQAARDVSHAAKLALLGIGTLATGAFGVLSLAAGYKYKKKHAPDPSRVTPQSYLDDLVHLQAPWQGNSKDGAAAAGESKEKEEEEEQGSEGGMEAAVPGFHSSRRSRVGSDPSPPEMEAKRRADIACWETFDDEERAELTFTYKAAAFAHSNTATPSFPLPPALLSHVSSFLPFESMCCLSSVSRSLHAFSSTLLADRGFVFRLARSKEGFSEQFRGEIWMRITGAGALANSMGRRASGSARENFYEHLVRLTHGYREQIIRQNSMGGLRSLSPAEQAAAAAAAAAAASASASSSDVDLSDLTDQSRNSLETILKDVPRTLVASNTASSSLISSLGQGDAAALSPNSLDQQQLKLDALMLQSSRDQLIRSLSDLLSVYSIHDTETGYCQGMNFVASFLLQKLPEQDAYWLYYKVMQGPEWSLRNFYRNDLHGLLVCKYQFQFLFQLYLPALFAHFERENVHSDIFTEWFMTIFTFSSFPRRYPLLDRLWDLLLAGRGLKYMFRVALSILHLSQATLLMYEFEDIIFYIKHLPDEGILDPAVVLPLACDHFRVSNRALKEIERRFIAQEAQAEESRRKKKQKNNSASKHKQ